MLINFIKKDSGIKVVPLVDVNQQVAVSGKEKNVILFPGWNEVTPEEWKLAEPHLEQDIEDGFIELNCKVDEVKDPATDEIKTVRVDKAMADVRVDHARKIVDGCVNIFNLKKWTEDPKVTSDIRNAAAIQLQKIENYGNK